MDLRKVEQGEPIQLFCTVSTILQPSKSAKITIPNRKPEMQITLILHVHRMNPAKPSFWLV